MKVKITHYFLQCIGSNVVGSFEVRRNEKLILIYSSLQIDLPETVTKRYAHSVIIYDSLKYIL